MLAGEDRSESGMGLEGEGLDMGSLMRESAMEKWWEEEKMREAFGGYGADVEEAMVVAEEAEEEERELQQVEDMLDYYLSRAAMAEDEAQQMLSGARDLEESIGVSLSARRLEVRPMPWPLVPPPPPLPVGACSDRSDGVDSTILLLLLPLMMIVSMSMGMIGVRNRTSGDGDGDCWGDEKR